MHIPKGYIYSAVAFSLGVQLLLIKIRKKSEHPVQLKHRVDEEQENLIQHILSK